MSRKNKKETAPRTPARFATGTRVRVKPGTTVPDFLDIPLGGWAGTIREVDQTSALPVYLIEWNRHTLAHIHPIYRKRCERDGLELESMWLGEDDVEPDSGAPAVIEQPTRIVTRPLNEKDQPCLECKLCVAACPVGAISPEGDFNFANCLTHNYREFMSGFSDWVESSSLPTPPLQVV